MMLPKASVWLGLGLALIWLSAARPSMACESDDPAQEPVTEEPAVSVISASQVQLNEFLPAPSSGEEFIELEVLDTAGGYLHGWSVQDASGKRFTFDQAAAETHADRYFVLSAEVSNIALNNTGDKVELLNPSGEVVESVEFGTAESDVTWSRFESGWDWGVVSMGGENVELAEEEEGEGEEDEEEDGEEEDEGETEEEDEQAEERGSGTGLSAVTQLKLNELLPNPEGDESTDEWIELLNEGEAGTLLGWSVTDGTSTYQLKDIEVEQGEFVVVGAEESGLQLNNTGDVVYLVGPEGEIVQGVEYTDAPSGESFARFDEAWEWTDQVTEGGVNVEGEDVEADGEGTGEVEGGDEEGDDTKNEEEQQDAVTLSELRGLDKGTAVVVSGVVVVEPGPLGAQVMYIQDETGGMQIYSYTKDFPAEVMRGSLVSVSGVTSSAYGEVRVNADEDGIVVVEQQDEVLPTAVSSLEVQDVGELVVVEGSVASKSTSKLMLDSGIEVYIKSSTGISLSEVEEGAQVRVVGVVGQYNDTLRLLPREQEDVVVSVQSEQGVTVAAAAETGQPTRQVETQERQSLSGWVVLGLAGVVILVGSIKSWWKKKRVAKRLFQPYTTGHESQRSVDSGRGVPAQLPPGVRS